jgi:hypothetical protein
MLGLLNQNYLLGQCPKYSVYKQTLVSSHYSVTLIPAEWFDDRYGLISCLLVLLIYTFRDPLFHISPFFLICNMYVSIHGTLCIVTILN